MVWEVGLFAAGGELPAFCVVGDLKSIVFDDSLGLTCNLLLDRREMATVTKGMDSTEALAGSMPDPA